MIGKLKDLLRLQGGEWLVSFTTREDPAAMFDELHETTVRVDIKKAAKHRSLSANNYAWVLIDKIAEKTGIPVTEVYQAAIREIGGVSDYYGMKALIERIGIDLTGKKVLVLGTGGTSKTARVVAADLGAAEILTVSRRKTDHYITYEEAVQEHADANVIINTTPSGMYPDCEFRPIDITEFTQLIGVVDVVYNPLCTNLVLDAKQRGIKAEGGLYMLIMQAVVAVERFLDTRIAKEVADRVFASIFASKENVVLTGMPGSGKSTVGKCLNIEGFEFVDTDEEIEKRCGCSIKELIQEKGEASFRTLETEVIREVSSMNCRIISTGGGAVLKEENVRALKRNGKLYFLNADLSRLQATDSRPLSDTQEKLARLYTERMSLYTGTADVVVPNLRTPQDEADYITTKREELIL